MFCEKCGAEIPKGAKFCEKCGASVESELQERQEGNSHKKWILGGIMGGIFVAAVVVISLFATGVLGSRKGTVQTGTAGGMQADAGGSDAAAQPTEQPAELPTEQPAEQPTAQADAMPVITPSPVPVPAENPVENEETEETDIQTPDDATEDTDEENSEYIFPNSDFEYLTKSDVKKLSANKINLAKNELYARHGRKFDREDLQEYFEGCSWYMPIYSAKEWDEYGDAYFFNEYEIKNRNLLKKWEDKKK